MALCVPPESYTATAAHSQHRDSCTALLHHPSSHAWPQAAKPPGLLKPLHEIEPLLVTLRLDREHVVRECFCVLLGLDVEAVFEGLELLRARRGRRRSLVDVGVLVGVGRLVDRAGNLVAEVPERAAVGDAARQSVTDGEGGEVDG